MNTDEYITLQHTTTIIATIKKCIKHVVISHYPTYE
jgi:hypothetical protein